ncbi:putative RNA-binding protein YlxR (DUF448 family) [Bacillus horti]|uniref:RNA-binding protein YlxR (DUF448 family) n=2 Tax=Caldalkalibacillus horti TaxID=77523 RepID=A0ABT9VUP0_9BACI|nr:putative RNA-binding protein YlxR (DUF448 family) [Bacillus horti]
MKNKKIPLRKCIACQEMKEKKSLIRIVRTPESEIKLDPTGKASGRGAYVCTEVECLEKLQKNKALERSFKMKISNQVYDELLLQLKADKA